MLISLLHDESGFVISAELVLVATICVIGLVVGLSEVQHSVVQEMNDVADAVGSLNQSYYYGGMRAYKTGWRGFGVKSIVTGSAFTDFADDCDYNQCSLACDGAVHEGGWGRGVGGGAFHSGGTVSGGRAYATDSLSAPAVCAPVVNEPVVCDPVIGAPVCDPVIQDR